MSLIPKMRGPSLTKCSSHRSVRGWNNRVKVPVSGSMLARFGPFSALHQQHARAKFSAKSSPLCCLAITCSTWNGVAVSSHCRSRQYSQRCSARSLTYWRRALSMTTPGIASEKAVLAVEASTSVCRRKYNPNTRSLRSQTASLRLPFQTTAQSAPPSRDRARYSIDSAPSPR